MNNDDQKTSGLVFKKMGIGNTDDAKQDNSGSLFKKMGITDSENKVADRDTEDAALHRDRVSNNRSTERDNKGGEFKRNSFAQTPTTGGSNVPDRVLSSKSTAAEVVSVCLLYTSPSPRDS